MNTKKIIEIYNQKLVYLKTKYKEAFVKTSYGKTNVLIFGDSNKPALFLLHGLNSGSPFAFDIVSFLLKKYQIFAIDILGQPNKSDFIKLNKKDDSYGKWLLEVVNHFKMDSCSLCGISFGAFPILKSLLIDEKRVEKVFLVSPAGVINGNLFKSITQFLIPIKKYQKTKKEKYLQACFSNLHDEFDNFQLQYLKEIFLNFKMDFSITPNFKSNKLAILKTPISIIASQNDFFVPALKLKKRSEKKFTSLKNFVVLENSKHIPSKVVLENIFKELD